MKKGGILILCIGFLLGNVLAGNSIFSGNISDTNSGSNSLSSLDSSMGKIKDKNFKSSIVDANFGKTFGNNNYRGALPKPESIDLLKNTYHIKTIISLIATGQMSKELQERIKKSGLEWIVIPLTKYPPKSVSRKKILVLLKRGNVFVHCIYGADRTGAIIARAWVELENQSPDLAYKDMLTYNPKVEKIPMYKEAFKYLKNFIYHGI